MRLLICEDSALWAEMLAIVYATRAGYETSHASSGFAALLDPAHVAWFGVDCLIVDLDLGAGQPTGLDLLRVAHKHHPEIATVVLSGQKAPHPDVADLAHVVLTKPQTVDELLEAPETAVRRARAATS